MKINDIKIGMNDAASMLKDRNFKPFSRPVFVLILVVGVFWLLYQGTDSQITDMRKKYEAQAVELENKQEYLKAKAKYIKLTQTLPSNTKITIWHPSQLMSIRDKLKLPPDALSIGNEIKTAEGALIISTIPIRGELTFEQIGRLLEAIENNPTFMRVSDLKISRKIGDMEKLNVAFNTNTVFIQDKDFPALVGGKNEK